MANDLVPGVEVQNFPLADGFTSNDRIPGFRLPGGPGSELLYTRQMFGNAGGGGYWRFPEEYGAHGDGVTDDTAAFTALLNQAPARGMGIFLDPTKCYPVNITILQDNITIASLNGSGPQDVLAGLTAFNPNLPCIIVGPTNRQLYRFRMNGVRVYSKTAQFGVQFRSCAYGRIDDCEFGGFRNYVIDLTSLAAGAGAVYYLRFNTCSVFSTAAGAGNMIQAVYGGSFVAAVSFNGCDIDGSAPTASTFRTMRIADAVDLNFAENTWFTCRHNKGVDIVGNPLTAGRLSGECMIDTPDNPDTAVLLSYPGDESSSISFVSGFIRINGQVRNGLGTVSDFRGPFRSGRGQFYGSKLFRPDIIGPLQLIEASAGIPLTGGPIIQTSGGGPEGSIAAPIGSSFHTRNNEGSSNTHFAKVTGTGSTGWERMVTGDFLSQTAGNATIDSGGRADLIGTNLNPVHGDYVFVGGSFNLGHLGTAKSGIRRVVQIINDGITMLHAASGHGIYITGYLHNILLVAGDMFEVVSQGPDPLGGGGIWRLMWITPSNGRVIT